MATTPDRNISGEAKQKLVNAIIQQSFMIIYDEASAKRQAWEQISAETDLSVTQCMDEWKNMRQRLLRHKDKVYKSGEIDWELAKDFLLLQFEEKKLKTSMTSPAPAAAPSHSPSPSASPSPSSSRVVSPQEAAQNTVLDVQQQREQQLNIKPRLEALEYLVQRLPSDDAEKLVKLFTDLAIAHK